MWMSPIPAKIKQSPPKECSGFPRLGPTATMVPLSIATCPGRTPSISASRPAMRVEAIGLTQKRGTTQFSITIIVYPGPLFFQPCQRGNLMQRLLALIIGAGLVGVISNGALTHGAQGEKKMD